MQADFEVIANGSNITNLIRDRLIEIRITDKPGLESDSCEISLDDRDSRVEFPPKGATLRVSLGWMGEPLHYMGTYRVDEVELSGPPLTIVLRGKPADLRQEAKGQRAHAYEATTLADIVAQVAGRNGWEPVCRVQASVPRADQIGESDIHFITRMARQYGATAAIKDGKLLVMPRGKGASASGAAMPVLTLTPSMIDRYRLTFPDRSGHGGVKAAAHNAKTGQKEVIELPNPDQPPGGGAVHVDRHSYPNPQAAAAAAKSRLESLNRATCDGDLDLSGTPEVSAEKIVRLSGFKAGADGDYLVESVTHTYANKSWTTRVDISGGNAGKAGVGHGKKKGATTVLTVPPPT